MNVFRRNKEEAATTVDSAHDSTDDPLADIPKSQWERIWPVMACGAGLFSDGYINNVCRIHVLVPAVKTDLTTGDWIRLDDADADLW
jgi:hypothetical protein